MSVNTQKDKVRCFCSKCKIGGGKTISMRTYALHSKNDIIPQSNQMNIIIQNDTTIPDSTLVNELQSNVSSEHIVSNSNSTESPAKRHCIRGVLTKSLWI